MCPELLFSHVFSLISFPFFFFFFGIGFSILTSLLDLKVQKAYERSDLCAIGGWESQSLLQYQGVPARGLGSNYLASPYLTNEDNLKRHTSAGGREREKEGPFLPILC